MDTRIRVLGIAPYEGMKSLMSILAEEYPQIDLTLFVGDLEQGLEIAKSNFHGNYDVVISRGRTANMLRENLPLPVIEIEISIYDILCTVKLADGLANKIAIVSVANIASSARSLCDLMGYKLDIFTYDSYDAAEELLLQLQKDNYQTILCDVVTNNISRRLGMNSFLITSSIDSIRKAFDQALMLCHSQRHLRNENLFLRELIHGQISQTLVFDSDGNLFLSTIDEPKPELLNLLRRELPESQKEPKRRVIRTLGGMLYAIRSWQILSDRVSYVAFFVDIRKTPLSPNQVGIRFFTRSEAESTYYNSIFGFAGIINSFQDKIDQIGQSNAPVMVTGEDGTGKESMVCALYMKSPLQNNPLVSINCNLLNDKSWAFLLEHHNSPLADAENTLYFASIDVLSFERRQQLLAVLSEMNVCQRNRVIFSCVCQPGEYMSAIGSMFIDKLCCLSLYLPPLQQMADRIPTLVNLFLSYLNAGLSRRIISVEPEAMTLLQNFQWPHNYTQFRRIIEELAITAQGQVITADSVSQLLRKERHVGAFSPHAENATIPLDLNQTLDEINRDVAIRVVKETGGNQTAAAKRLGISRTTIWRLLQK